jgi:hypothetical protein
LFSAQKPHENVEEHRKIQNERPLNQHINSATSTNTNEMPSVGSDKPPPELLSSVDPNFEAKKAERATVDKDLNVGEIEGGKFRVEPLRRTGEDASTMRARLLCSFLSKPAMNHSVNTSC